MWQIHQLERLGQIEPEFINKTLVSLLRQETALWEKLVIGAYLDEEINFGKVAELLELHPVELKRQFLTKGIPIRIGVESKEAILADQATAKAIRKSVQ